MEGMFYHIKLPWNPSFPRRIVQTQIWKWIPRPISGGVDITEVLGCHLLGQMSSLWGSQKLLHGNLSHSHTN